MEASEDSGEEFLVKREVNNPNNPNNPGNHSNPNNYNNPNHPCHLNCLTSAPDNSAGSSSRRNSGSSRDVAVVEGERLEVVHESDVRPVCPCVSLSVAVVVITFAAVIYALTAINRLIEPF
jgi:hypothetical protein